MAVIAVASLLRGIDKYAREKVAEEGSNVFKIERFNDLEVITDFDKFLQSLKHNPPIRRSDVPALRSSLKEAQYVSAFVSGRIRVNYAGRTVRQMEVRGQDEFYPFIDNVEVEMGRHLTRLDVETNAPVAVIGWEVYQTLIEPREPVGAVIKLGDRHVEVVGVARKKGSVLGQSQDRFAIVPIGAYQKIFGPAQSIQIKIRAGEVMRLADAIDEARIAMRSRHHLRPGVPDDFSVTTSEQLVALWRKISGGIMLALIVLVSISLIVGGIVLMNTMLVAVTERTREIGIRKALGARKRDITWQFLVESSTMSFFGGLFGMLIGVFIALMVSVFTPIPYSFDVTIVAVAFVATLGVGLLFGTYPAVKAARLNPVDALRHE